LITKYQYRLLVILLDKGLTIEEMLSVEQMTYSVITDIKDLIVSGYLESTNGTINMDFNEYSGVDELQAKALIEKLNVPNIMAENFKKLLGNLRWAIRFIPSSKGLLSIEIFEKDKKATLKSNIAIGLSVIAIVSSIITTLL
jgi:hypothetical protein